jgi:hypothetical protein
MWFERILHKFAGAAAIEACNGFTLAIADFRAITRATWRG